MLSAVAACVVAGTTTTSLLFFLRHRQRARRLASSSCAPPPAVNRHNALLASSEVECDRLVKKLLVGHAVLGMDVEWGVGQVERDSGPRKAAVLQLASADGVVVIHLAALGVGIPECLIDILASASIIKCGVEVM